MARLRVNVSGGTRAGWRLPFRGRPAPWQCCCIIAGAFKTNIGALIACPDCKTRRPT